MKKVLTENILKNNPKGVDLFINQDIVFNENGKEYALVFTTPKEVAEFAFNAPRATDENKVKILREKLAELSKGTEEESNLVYGAKFKEYDLHGAYEFLGFSTEQKLAEELLKVKPRVKNLFANEVSAIDVAEKQLGQE